MSRSKKFATNKNNAGNKESPCRTPRADLKISDGTPLIKTKNQELANERISRTTFYS